MIFGARELLLHTDQPLQAQDGHALTRNVQLVRVPEQLFVIGVFFDGSEYVEIPVPCRQLNLAAHAHARASRSRPARPRGVAWVSSAA